MAEEVDREPLEISEFSDKLRQHVERDAPAKMKMMAAQGMVPAPPDQSVKLLYQLHFDDEANVREAVESAINDMPENVLVGVLEDLDDAGLLDWVADHRGESGTVVEALLRNQTTDNRTVARLAGEADKETCEIIATNEVRVLDHPRIIEELFQNASARMATVDQLIELAQRNEVSLEGLPGVERTIKADRRADEQDKKISDEEFEAFLEQEIEQAEREDEKLEKLEDEDLTRSEREELREEFEEELEQGDDEEGGRRTITTGDLNDMTVAQKIRLAMTGSRQAIKKLVKDPNKLVHMAAIESPRLKAPDAVRLASRKSVPEGVISYIANNREWTQNYECVKHVVHNPKTPVSDALDLLNRLRNNELKKLQQSREVPHQVTRAAERLYDKRTGRGGGRR